MQFVPWQQISNWMCIGCGNCCRKYSVVLKFQEWLGIIKNFGVRNTVAGIDKLFIKRLNDGSCSFLCYFANNYLCGLQQMKPHACKLWPFKVLEEPKYGLGKKAVFNYNGNRLYIYADSNCSGLLYGTPTWEFRYLSLKEFVELALGVRVTQCKTTANLIFQPKRWIKKSMSY